MSVIFHSLYNVIGGNEWEDIIPSDPNWSCESDNEKDQEGGYVQGAGITTCTTTLTENPTGSTVFTCSSYDQKRTVDRAVTDIDTTPPA